MRYVSSHAARQPAMTLVMALLRRFPALVDELLHAIEIARRDVLGGEQVAHDGGRVTGEERLGERTQHRAPNLPLRHGGAVDERAALGTMRNDAALLEPREEGG